MEPAQGRGLIPIIGRKPRPSSDLALWFEGRGRESDGLLKKFRSASIGLAVGKRRKANVPPTIEPARRLLPDRLVLTNTGETINLVSSSKSAHTDLWPGPTLIAFQRASWTAAQKTLRALNAPLANDLE